MFLLGIQSLLPQNAVGSEWRVVEAATNSTFGGSAFDSTLLLSYFNLDLEHQITQKMISNDIKVMEHRTEWKPNVMAENGRFFPFILDGLGRDIRLNSGFETTQMSIIDAVTLPKTNVLFNALEANTLQKKTALSINPLPAHLVLPPMAQAPTQSNVPDPLSLLMLSIGGVALLGWSRRKRKKQHVHSMAQEAFK